MFGHGTLLQLGQQTSIVPQRVPFVISPPCSAPLHFLLHTQVTTYCFLSLRAINKIMNRILNGIGEYVFLPVFIHTAWLFWYCSKLVHRSIVEEFFKKHHITFLLKDFHYFLFIINIVPVYGCKMCLNTKGCLEHSPYYKLYFFSYCCHNTIPQIDWLKATQIYFVSALKVRSLK